MKKILNLVITLSLFSFASLTFAVPLNNLSELEQGFTRINFDELLVDVVPATQYAAQGVTIRGTTGPNGSGLPTDIVTTTFFDIIYIGTEGFIRNGSVIFELSSPVTQFAAYIIDAGPTTIAVYDSTNTLIESVDLSSGNIEDFSGIDTGGPLISRAVISGRFAGVNEILFNNPNTPSILDVQFIPSADWGAGYCGSVSITNTSSESISDWSVNLNTNSSRISENRWNADFSSPLTGTVTISTNFSWNNVIAAGQTDASVGFCADRADPNGSDLPFIESSQVGNTN